MLQNKLPYEQSTEAVYISFPNRILQDEKEVRVQLFFPAQKQSADTVCSLLNNGLTLVFPLLDV